MRRTLGDFAAIKNAVARRLPHAAMQHRLHLIDRRVDHARGERRQQLRAELLVLLTYQNYTLISLRKPVCLLHTLNILCLVNSDL